MVYELFFEKPDLNGIIRMLKGLNSWGNIFIKRMKISPLNQTLWNIINEPDNVEQKHPPISG